MGILVSEATLPSGIQVSNVYMSFSDEPVYMSRLPDGYQVYSYYKVWSNSLRDKPADIRILLTIKSPNADNSVHSILYDGLKQLYPNYTDHYNNIVSTCNIANPSYAFSNVMPS
jgi:hypothetical protein